VIQTGVANSVPKMTLGYFRANVATMVVKAQACTGLVAKAGDK
jgi:hypothetical protein